MSNTDRLSLEYWTNRTSRNVADKLPTYACEILNDSGSPIQIIHVRFAIFNETLGRTFSIVCVGLFLPLGTVRPLYRTGVSLLSRESFLYI